MISAKMPDVLLLQNLEESSVIVYPVLDNTSFIMVFVLLKFVPEFLYLRYIPEMRSMRVSIILFVPQAHSRSSIQGVSFT